MESGLDHNQFVIVSFSIFYTSMLMYCKNIKLQKINVLLFYCTDTVLCPSPEQPDGGSVSVSSMFVGGRAWYSCRYGYQLFGSSVRYCQLSGEWNGVQPTCESKHP